MGKGRKRVKVKDETNVSFESKEESQEANKVEHFSAPVMLGDIEELLSKSSDVPISFGQSDLLAFIEDLKNRKNKYKQSAIHFQDVCEQQQKKIWSLQEQLEIYERKFGKVQEIEEIRSAPEFVELDKLPSNKVLDRVKNELNSSGDSAILTLNGEYAAVSLNKLTKSQRKKYKMELAKTKQLDHSWITPKAALLSKIKSPKLIKIVNRASVEIYVTVYDKLRVGVGHHERISPVYPIASNQEFSFVKPFATTKRTRWLLYCRSRTQFHEESPNMTESLFKTIPKFSIDFCDEIHVTEKEDGSLKARSKFETWTSKLSLRKSKNLSGFEDEFEINEHFRRGTSLCDSEVNYLKIRKEKAKIALENFLGINLDGKYVPRIAFCGSGGGCRAMISTIGSLIAAEKCGLTDAFSHAAGVSGSTWALGLWVSLHLNTFELKENIIQKFENNTITRPSKRSVSQLITMLRKNFSHKQKSVISLIDIYGAQLSAGLLSDTVPQSYKYRLHHQMQSITNADYPLPIYTAVQKSVDSSFDWFEFTPFEVGCTAFNAFVPSNHFGCPYVSGKIVEDNHKYEPSFGVLLATFGSAFCAPLSRVAEEFFDKLEAKGELAESSPIPEIDSPSGTPKRGRAYSLLEKREQYTNLLHKLKVKNSSIATPAVFSNFAYDPAVEGSKQRNQTIELSDAGIDFNLPFPALLRPEREIDIIIACNSSKSPNICKGRALKGAAKWAAKHNIPFPEIDFAASYNNQVSVYKCDGGPTIIYLPLKKNERYSDFDPQVNQLIGGYCSTFNFSMTRDQVDELSGLSEFNFLESVDVMKSTILEVIEHKTESLK